ncbi:hypothetical protein C477_12442 [Haloterrigena salina JCM 13891]|uniref:ATPase n=1 Tax=Haloterrigena salina JCM 13891 TaxID=1227488 RepID=M0C4B1_9EURY|nr:hypothetical protein [Haloterrigena salina]ELZ18015.1 hypothetical protein C477_12442 [Haloterrigena salina JCM 13891]
MVTKDDLLTELDFGSVNAESEEELAKRFVRTHSFNDISDGKKLIILGPKGSGKSAIFRLFTDYTDETRRILGDGFPENTHIIKATGGNDVRSIDTRSLKEMMKQDDFSYERFWRIYIGLKTASRLGEEGYDSEGELGDVLRAFDEQPDWRIIPALKTVWEKVVGDPPSQGKVSYRNFSIEFSNDRSLDISRLLEDEQRILEEKGESVWLMLDRIDELRSKNLDERKELLEALFRVQLNFMGRFENIRLKILLRTDIWSDLNFTNKSHIWDKRIELEWNDTQLLRLINKRMLQSDLIRKGIEESLSTSIDLSDVEQFDKETQEELFYSVFEDQVYSGPREADLFDWMTKRIRDGHGGKYPRELISFCNEARKIQLRKESDSEDRLIAGLSVRDAYEKVSQQRRETYLTEFPELDEHFDRFDGKTQAEFTHDDLVLMFEDLEPKPADAIKRMVDIGFFEEKRGEDEQRIYEIPRLYRDGIGLVLKGRP